MKRRNLALLCVCLTFALGISVDPGANARANPAGVSAGGQEFYLLPILFQNFNAGPGNVFGKVFDSSSGQPLDEAMVCYGSNCVETDFDGNYVLEDIPAGAWPFTASLNLYFPLTSYHLVKAGQDTELNFFLSSSLNQGEYRIIVTWDDEPADLDAHLWTPDPAIPHVSLDNRGTCPPDFPVTTACLDLDDQDGYGPETITIFESTGLGDSIYSYAVLNFNRPFGAPPMTTSGAQVLVYNYQGLQASFSVPVIGDPDLDTWYVFDLHGDTETITLKNCLTTFPADPDQPPVCP